MGKKQIALIGAGKLGKGYVADLFGKAGYEVIFLARRQQQVDTLRRQGSYTVYVSHEDGSGISEKKVSGYQAWCSQGEEREQCLQILTQVPIASVQIYDNGFAEAGKLLGEAIARRAELPEAGPLDILLVVNYSNPDRIFANYIEQELHTEQQRTYFREKVGLVKTLAFRGGFTPTAEQLAEDPEAICASDYPELPVDRDAFRGSFPQEVNGLLPLDKMDERLKAKLWTANMQAGAIGSMGKAKGYHLYNEAAADEQIQKFAERCYEEALYGIEHLFHMSKEDYALGSRKKVPLAPGAKARVTTDVIDRQMFGLNRKLGREERLIGPAMACLEGGRLPYFLAKAAAYAFDFDNPADPASVEVLAYVREQGIEKAVSKYCGLSLQNDKERILHQLICGHYVDLHE
jgi:mannitol-1-phosphate 5-dehydrogenase